VCRSYCPLSYESDKTNKLNELVILNILQINTADIGGGAESSARNLHIQYKKYGYTSWLAVGRKFTNDKTVIRIPLFEKKSLLSPLYELLRTSLEKGQLKFQPISRLRTWLPRLISWRRFNNWFHGGEDCLGYEVENLINNLPEKPDVIHCHNLHGGYFNLESLTKLSHKYPIILNLCDTWLLTGHCSYSFNCERWQNGCGNCPDISIYPSIRKDRTDENWIIKKEIYEKSQLYVVGNSNWTINQAKQSMLKAADYTVIENGIDQKEFCPGDKVIARDNIGLSQKEIIIMFAANNIKKNRFKDFDTMEKAMSEVAERSSKTITFVCVGQKSDTKKISDNAKIIFTGYIDNINKMVNYYRAADVYIHAAKAEASGKTITEALSCGTPVVATNIGGIPEQVIDGVNGYLYELENYSDMADKIISLLNNDELRMKMSRIAPTTVERFNINNQTDQFINYYRKVIVNFNSIK